MQTESLQICIKTQVGGVQQNHLAEKQNVAKAITSSFKTTNKRQLGLQAARVLLTQVLTPVPELGASEL